MYHTCSKYKQINFFFEGDFFLVQVINSNLIETLRLHSYNPEKLGLLEGAGKKNHAATFGVGGLFFLRDGI